ILELLQRINRELSITIIIITHEMSVVRKICDSVAILSGGHIVETGSVLDIFSHPTTEEARGLIFRDHESHPKPEDTGLTKTGEIGGKKYRIVYTGENKPDEPVIANLILKFKSPVNILYADTKEVLGKARGQMVVRFPGDSEETEQMLAYLEDCGLYVEEVSR
ncbi:MAG: methionine ABC transporter ATP-binding protein, partial [Lachnospiraceae bacterium]|nr:methionine ABC transporter ATP-binding protein [Lachnospiraceae bacterium]